MIFFSISLYIKLVTTFLLAFGISFHLIPLLCRMAMRVGALDVPDNKLKSHKQTIPYFGGLAVYGGFLVAVSLMLPVENKLFLFIVGNTILLMTGLLDDFVVLSPSQKLSGQIFAALCFLKAGLYLKESFFSTLWTIPVSFLWLLSVINAFNLVDVMDGLATILALSSIAAFFCAALIFQQPQLLILLIALAGALTAFFLYNKPPATIYLGDAGSLFIGGFCAAIPFFFPWGIYNIYGFLVPIGILALVLFELVSLIIIRLYKKIPFYQGSHDHFSHYLQRKGWSKHKILLLSAVMTLISSGVALCFGLNIITFPVAVIAGVFYLATLISIIFYSRI